MNLQKEINNIKTEYKIYDHEFERNFAQFLVQNNWFGVSRKIINGQIEVDNDIFEIKQVIEYLKHYDADISIKVDMLKSKLEKKLPQTYKVFQKYINILSPDIEDEYILVDFLCFSFPTEIFDITQNELDEVVEMTFDTLNKRSGNMMIQFFNWCRQNYCKGKNKVKYTNIYVFDKRVEICNEAYDEQEYLTMIYHFFNEEYIRENRMYQKAADSAKYANAWLFLCLHFVDALRDTDLVRLKHPDLPMDPMMVLDSVINDEFSDEDAQKTLYSVYWYIEYMMLKPNKTKKHDVPKINFHVPVSLEGHIGKLFAILEAHCQLEKREDFIRPVKSYQEITRIMGDEIGNLFLDANFRSRSSNKSFMQLIETMTDNVLGESDDEFHVKGYMLASLARSHKRSYGDFAHTTVTYLRDARLSGLTAEFVAREMLERGVLSFVPMMLLEMLGDEEYKTLGVTEQTKAINMLDMSLVEINNASALAQNARQQSSEIAREIYSKTSNDEILGYLHRIGNGQAVSKQKECLCMLTAMHKECPFLDKKSCIGCAYEISTRSTMYMLASEYKRLSFDYKMTNDSFKKQKAKALLKSDVIPAMSAIVDCTSQYSLASKESLEAIIDSAVTEIKLLTNKE